MKFIGRTHLAHHNALEEGVRKFDEYMESEYGSPAEESAAMKAALAWYDKMVVSFVEASAEGGPQSMEVVVLRAEVAALKEEVETMKAAVAGCGRVFAQMAAMAKEKD